MIEPITEEPTAELAPEQAEPSEPVAPAAPAAAPPGSDGEHRALIERLRTALAASEPGVTPELLTGETVEELEASLVAARALVAGVRRAVLSEAAAAVPAGAPGRSPAVPGNAFEKIRAGLGRLAAS